ncbi:uncharacterized protein LOC136755526 [Amia ocellicauda]|uniref:uncharacterized protein LOC136755526 n=1 Tax=Amia ocellicauda TaxID=2972642 RepID=UPI0034641493
MLVSSNIKLDSKLTVSLLKGALSPHVEKVIRVAVDTLLLEIERLLSQELGQVVDEKQNSGLRQTGLGDRGTEAGCWSHETVVPEEPVWSNAWDPQYTGDSNENLIKGPNDVPEVVCGSEQNDRATNVLQDAHCNGITFFNDMIPGLIQNAGDTEPQDKPFNQGGNEDTPKLADREVKEEPRDDEGDVIEVKVPDQVHVSAALLANTGLGKSPGPYPFSCPECHLVFSCPSELREHRWATHCGDRPYCCSECGRGFSQLANLKKHYLIHTGERPHHCTQCGKSFRHLCNLNKHRLVHTGERPFPCTQCGKRFRQLPHLKEHQGVHIGAKQFHCSVCGKNVSSRWYLKRHQQAHHEQNLC